MKYADRVGDEMPQGMTGGDGTKINADRSEVIPPRREKPGTEECGPIEILRTFSASRKLEHAL